MSRIGEKPVLIPKGVEVKWVEGKIRVQGPKGELFFSPHPEIHVEISDGEVRVSRVGEKKFHKALHGTTRQLIANMIQGVSQGFTKELELVGTGYRVKLEGRTLVFAVGYSHPVEYEPPPGVKLEVEAQTKIRVFGISKEEVGQVAAEIRAIKPPEPYKGKGIRYVGEVIRKKAGKAGVKAK